MRLNWACSLNGHIPVIRNIGINQWRLLAITVCICFVRSAEGKDVRRASKVFRKLARFHYSALQLNIAITLDPVWNQHEGAEACGVILLVTRFMLFECGMSDNKGLTTCKTTLTVLV